ncbi:MAG: ribonuclease R [Rhodospirillaceae bacterium]|nr:MAG: ribonuclease R [Rhodospirillaceae bacterium]
MPKRPSTFSLPTKEQLSAYIRQHEGPLHTRDLARALSISGPDRVVLKRMLRELETEGAIASPPKRRSQTGPLPAVAVVDIHDTDSEGELLARPVAWNEQDPIPRIVMLQARGQPALGVGNRILARLRAIGDHTYEGKSIRTLTAAAARVIGIYDPLPEGGRVCPADRREKSDLIIAPGDTLDVESGALVLAEVMPGRRYGARRARVIERLGHRDDPCAISLISIVGHGLPHTFPPEALAQAVAAEPVDLGTREDLRALPLVTIDGEDARDFDDAVWAQADTDPENPDGWHVVVAIADVAGYVRPGDALDRTARLRGNSVYFPDRVVPMLPEALSNGWCSLVPGEDRPCLAVHLWLDREGRTVKRRFVRGLMRSTARLTYHQVQAARDGAPDTATAPLLGSVIAPLYGAYQALARWRMARGTLELDLPERRVVLDDAGTVLRVEPRLRYDSHRLIEECMIAANVAAAEQLESLHRLCLYRIHDQPTEEKLQSLRDFLSSIGLKLSRGQVLRAQHFNHILARAATTPHGIMVNEVVLRSQAQAEYNPANIGHFGLGLPRYMHFTSPIRRYADLLVHRALIAGLALGEGGDNPSTESLAETGEHVSRTERRAASAERDAINRYATAFLAAHVGATFAARVNGVTRSGLFVTLEETGADGLIPIGTLGEDYFMHDEIRRSLTGRRTGATYRLADAVTVKLHTADPLTGSLTFLLADTDSSPRSRKGTRRR